MTEFEELLYAWRCIGSGEGNFHGHERGDLESDVALDALNSAANSPEVTASAINFLETYLRDWRWSMGHSSGSADGSCAPDAAYDDRHLRADRVFDNGFHVEISDGSEPGHALIMSAIEGYMCKHHRAEFDAWNREAE